MSLKYCLDRVMVWWKNWFLWFSLKSLAFKMWKLCHLPVIRKNISVLSSNFFKWKSKASGIQTTGQLSDSTVHFGTTSWKEFVDEGKRSSECGVEKIGKSWTTQGNHVSDFYLSMRSDKLLGLFLFLSHSKHGH